MKDEIISVTVRKTRIIDGLEVTMEVPVQSLVNRTIHFPDFGIEIDNDTPLPETITSEDLNAEKEAGRLVAEEFLNIYPEAVGTSDRNTVIEQIASLYADAWAKGTDLDLTNFNGVVPHSK